MIFNQVLVATMMMLAASASFDDVAVSAAVRGLKLGKNGPPPPGPKKRHPKKNSKKNRRTSMPATTSPIPAPTLIPPPEPTDFPTAAPEPTDEPTEALLDIPNTLQEEGYGIFVEALTRAGLIEDLSSPNESFTVFAPTHTAFGLMDQDLLQCLLEPRFKDVLQDVVMYHVADGEYSTEQLVNDQVINMWDGDNILINIENDGTVVIDNAEVVFPNMMATNGILHGIDQVLMPPNFDDQEFLNICLGE